MTCNQLGGACDLEFKAETFEEISAMSKQHGMEMFQKGDQPHLNAMEAMKKKMTSPDDYGNWYNDRKKEFDAL
jgi:hypothetical protein